MKRLRDKKRSVWEDKTEGIEEEKKRRTFRFFKMESWQLPIFPVRYQTSILGVKGLHFCVRDGNRCFPFAIATSNG